MLIEGAWLAGSSPDTQRLKPLLALVYCLKGHVTITPINIGVELADGRTKAKRHLPASSVTSSTTHLT